MKLKINLPKLPRSARKLGLHTVGTPFGFGDPYCEYSHCFLDMF